VQTALKSTSTGGHHVRSERAQMSIRGASASGSFGYHRCLLQRPEGLQLQIRNVGHVGRGCASLSPLSGPVLLPGLPSLFGRGHAAVPAALPVAVACATRRAASGRSAMETASCLVRSRRTPARHSRAGLCATSAMVTVVHGVVPRSASNSAASRVRL
jgi:hypothetical protein